AAVSRTGRLLGVASGLNVLLTISFAFATVAPVYTRHLNGHQMQLGVAAVVFMLLARFARSSALSGRMAFIGVCCGFAYAIEQPTGGLLLLGTALALLVRRPRLSTALLFFLG